MASAVVLAYPSVQSHGKGSQDTAGSLQDMQKDRKRSSEYLQAPKAAQLASQQQQQQQQQQQLQAPRRHVTRGPYTGANQFSQKIELYRGSVSTVYRALDETAGQRVILKCYHKGKMQEKHYHKLDREIQAMQAMRGPYVADLYGWFQDDASVWLVMEWCEGGDLFKCMMVHGGRLDEFYVCTEIIAPLLRVLEKSHAQCFMHRDIKPENIFLTKGNRFRLGDFGLAVNWTMELPFSRSGTLDYMAPEVLRNPATTMQEGTRVQRTALIQRNITPYDEKVDIWAVGVLAYELVVGKPPFEVEDEAQTASLIMYSHSIRFPTAYSPLWADFVRTVLVKEPQQRPTAGQLMQHAWITHHVQSAILKAAAQGRVSSKQQLLKPFPLVPTADWINTPNVVRPVPAGAAAAAPSTCHTSATTSTKRAGMQVVAVASAGLTPNTPTTTANEATGVIVASPVPAPAPKQPVGLPPRTPQQPIQGSQTQAGMCYTQPALHMTHARQGLGTAFASPSTPSASRIQAGWDSGAMESAAGAGPMQAVRSHVPAHVAQQDCPPAAFAAQLERARSSVAQHSEGINASSGGFSAASYTTAASTFECVAAALEAAAGAPSKTQAGNIRQSQPLFTRTSTLYKTSSGSMTASKETAKEGTVSTTSSHTTMMTASNSNNGSAPRSATHVHNHAHGCVLVQHSNVSGAAASLPAKPPTVPALLRSMDTPAVAGFVQDMEIANYRPDATCSPARPVSASLRGQSSLRKLQLGDVGGQGSVSPASPSMQGIDMALPSPALPAGSKQRSLAHLKHQAWA